MITKAYTTVHLLWIVIILELTIPMKTNMFFFDFPELKGQSTGPSCISGDGFLSLHTFREVNPLRVLYVLRQNETPGAQMGLS